MADKSKADAKITRIKATDSTPKAKKADKPTKTVKATESKTATAEPVEAKRNVFVRIGGYFKGAWLELKQVRWPSRKATWGLTLAVLIFSAFFVAFILLLDGLFQYVFQLIIA